MKCNVTVEGFVASSVSFFPSGVGPSTTGLSGLTHSGSVAFFSEVFVFLEVVFSSEVFVFSAAIVFSSGDSVFSAGSSLLFGSLCFFSYSCCVFRNFCLLFNFSCFLLRSFCSSFALRYCSNVSCRMKKLGRCLMQRSKQESVLKDFCRLFFSFVPQHPFLNLP